MSGTEVVVVTGASAGVGRATVQAFARPGASIGLLAREWLLLAGAVLTGWALGSRLHPRETRAAISAR